MMKKYIIIACASTAFLAQEACKSVQKTASREELTVVESEDWRQKTEVRELQVEYYGDELIGFVPLVNASLADGDSLVIPTESGGVKQTLTITNKGIAYTTKAKPVARSSLKEETKTEDGSRKTEVKEVKEVETKEVDTWRFPWWIVMVAVGGLALTLCRRYKVWV